MNTIRLTIIRAVALTALVFSCAAAQDSRENADFKLAINLYNDKLYDLAAEQLKQFIARYVSTSQGIEARFYLGLTQMKLKQYDDARVTFQTFALSYQDNPRAPEAWWNVGEAYAAGRQFKEAALAFERVKTFHPRSKLAPDALLRASTTFTQAGEREDARRVLRVIIQEYPASNAVLAARTELGRMYFDDGNLEQAQNELKRVIEGDPSPDAQAQALLTLGNIYRAIWRTDLAQATYREIIARQKVPATLQAAHIQLGKILCDMGALGDGIAELKKILSSPTPPDSALTQEGLLALGEAYAANREYANAVAQYSKFIASSPNDERLSDVLWRAASASAKAANYVRSNEFCQKLLTSNTPDIMKRRALVRLARNAQAQKNYGLAVQLYTRCLEQYPDERRSPEILWQVAQLEEQQLRDQRKAAASYELLTSRYPRSPLADDATLAAARCYQELREYDRARQLYRELTGKFPSSKLREEAARQILMINTFEAKEKDAGLEKLALLIGDVVSEADRVGLSYKLGMIYFNDLKNYTAAAAQFTSAISSGMADERFVEALYLRAKSYEYLSWKDEKYRASAMETYDTFLQSYPREPRGEEAAIALFYLRATSPPTARAAFTALLSAYPNTSRIDTAALRLGELLESADSTREALATYNLLITQYPEGVSSGEASFRLMRIFRQLGLPDSLEAAGRRYLREFPNGLHSAKVLLELAALASRRGNPGQSADLLRQLMDECPYAADSISVHIQLAQALEGAGDHAGAIAAYRQVLEEQRNDPFTDGTEDPLLLLELGRIYQATGDIAQARTFLFKTLQRQPSGDIAAQAYNLLGMLARSENSVELATGYFRLAGTATPHPEANREIADLLFESGDYADAIRQYRLLAQAAVADSDRRSYEARIIVALLRDDNFTEAGRDISTFAKKYKDVDDHVASFELERGNYYFRKEEYPNAMKAYERVLDKYDGSPSAPVARYWMARTLEATGKLPEAVEQLTGLLKDHPGNPIVSRVRVALGNLYYSMEKWDESTKQYREIVDSPNPDKELLPFAMSNLIETYEAAEIFDAALALTRRYLELFPNNEDAFDKKIKIGILYQRLGYNDQSVAHLQGLLEQAGSDLEGEIRYYIAEANFNKGDYQQAILDFLKVPYLVTKKGKIDWTANALYMAGQAYERMGRHEQALQMYQQIVDRPGIDPTFKTEAKKEIDRVKLVLKKPSK